MYIHANVAMVGMYPTVCIRSAAVVSESRHRLTTL
jgi:hypothetical protein